MNSSPPHLAETSKGLEPDEQTGFIIDLIGRHLEAHLGDHVAGIFVEPVQGEGGYVIPPADFLPALQDLANERGIPIVADEVQAGFGRTGRMFASEHFGFVPDMMTLAKGMGSGMPIGALVTDAKMDNVPDSCSSDWARASRNVSQRASVCVAKPRNAAPAGVRLTLRLSRSKSGRPTSASSLWMERLRAEGLR